MLASYVRTRSRLSCSPPLHLRSDPRWLQRPIGVLLTLLTVQTALQRGGQGCRLKAENRVHIAAWKYRMTIFVMLVNDDGAMIDKRFHMNKITH